MIKNPCAVTARQLNRIAKESEAKGYNQLLLEDFAATGGGWELEPVFVHSWVGGAPCEPHLRCSVYRNGEELSFLDVSFDSARSLGWPANVIADNLRAIGRSDEPGYLPSCNSPVGPDDPTTLPN